MLPPKLDCTNKPMCRHRERMRCVEHQHTNQSLVFVRSSRDKASKSLADRYARKIQSQQTNKDRSKNQSKNRSRRTNRSIDQTNKSITNRVGVDSRQVVPEAGQYAARFALRQLDRHQYRRLCERTTREDRNRIACCEWTAREERRRQRRPGVFRVAKVHRRHICKNETISRLK